MVAMKSARILRLPLPAQPAARADWEARRLLRRLGWPALLAASCLAVACAGWWHAQTMAAQQVLLLARIAAASSTPAVPASPPPDTDERIKPTQASLPPHEALPEQLQLLMQVARDSGISLAKADYKPQQEVRANVLRYQITLPVKAKFSNVQRFIVNALQSMPTLTLESVTFRRERIESGTVEARIQLVLLVRKAITR